MNLTFVPNRSVTLVTSDYGVLTATADSPNWSAIEAAIKANDEQALISAISLKHSVQTFGATVKGRGEIVVRNSQVYYRGEKLFGEDVNRIISYLKGGFPQASMIRFLEAKLLNKFPESVAALYSFLENRGMPITDNGTVLGYKGVDSDYYSKTSGAEPLISGIRDELGRVRNQIGDVIWMDRRYVCADNSQGCAGGLHVGSNGYAVNFAGDGHVMIVEFSPEHVVSVPTSEHEKLRVYKYRVVGELKEDKALLDNTYDGEYVRPDDAEDPDESVEVSENQYCVADWSKGQSAGVKDGRSHQKRKFYECDKGRTFKKYSREFVDGYLAGYRSGRE
jgi:hypothetical protein